MWRTRQTENMYFGSKQPTTDNQYGFPCDKQNQIKRLPGKIALHIPLRPTSSPPKPPCSPTILTSHISLQLKGRSANTEFCSHSLKKSPAPYFSPPHQLVPRAVTYAQLWQRCWQHSLHNLQVSSVSLEKKYGPLIQMNNLQKTQHYAWETVSYPPQFEKEFVFLHLFLIAMSWTCKYCKWLSNTHLVNWPKEMDVFFHS